MSDYYACQVAANIYSNTNDVNHQGCPSDFYIGSRGTALHDAAVACAGAPKAGERTIIFFGSFQNPTYQCSPLVAGLTDSNDRSYMYITSGAPTTTVAHELGHSLGVPGDYSGQPTQLMNVNGNGTTITATQCTTARNNF